MKMDKEATSLLVLWISLYAWIKYRDYGVTIQKRIRVTCFQALNLINWYNFVNRTQ